MATQLCSGRESQARWHALAEARQALHRTRTYIVALTHPTHALSADSTHHCMYSWSADGRPQCAEGGGAGTAGCGGAASSGKWPNPSYAPAGKQALWCRRWDGGGATGAGWVTVR